MNFLITIAIIAGVLILVRVMNIMQLSTRLAGDNEQEEFERDIKVNARLMLVFLVGLFLFFFWSIWEYMPLTLPEAASEHGVITDKLLNINFLIIIAVFLITQILLFWFLYKYAYDRNAKAYYYPHDNRLEVIWTVIPTIVLAILVVTGLGSWNKITSLNNNDGMNIQIYSEQFSFSARYPGSDNKLGESYFKDITQENHLGMKMDDPNGKNDLLAKELHLVVNKPVMLNINSRDVLHSVYLPHFRTQMNAVPGMTTYFYFKPTITTAEMRKKTNNEKFDYVMLCNKICGVTHYMMNMKVVVETEAEFNDWLSKQKPAMPVATTTADATALNPSTTK